MNGRKASFKQASIKPQSCQNKQVMTPIEEDSLRKWTLYLFPSAASGSSKNDTCNTRSPHNNYPLTIGDNWLSKSLNRPTGLMSEISRPRDYIRAYCETQETPNGWFNRVENTIMGFGVEEHDVYHVGETGCAMGLLSADKVITGSNNGILG
ncbi:hypothetical protein JCM33374_g1908 [Metschnikowia sp. JCM 33374]|nr:hypothetical protein JCM33374_g1908 [Metschnikowia sp. JCM 33374]